GLAEGDQAVVRHLMLRLVRLGPDGETFEPEQVTRAALRDRVAWPAKVDEVLAGLCDAGIVRVTRTGSSDADVVELRARGCCSKCRVAVTLWDGRRAFRRRVERWAASQKPDDQFLHGEDLEEALTSHARNSLEQEFPDTSRRYKGRIEAARRTLERLELRD